MKEKFEKLRDLASDVSDTTIEDANTYTILSLCDQLGVRGLLIMKSIFKI